MRSAGWLPAAISLLIAGTLLVPAAANSAGKRSAGVAIAADIRPAALWDGRKEVEFHAADFPKMIKAADAKFLIDDEYVLGITGNGESRAYPTRFASWHHIINDKIGKPDQGGTTFVTVTYCIVCNSGIRFDSPQGHNKPLVFDFYGLYNGVMTMFDKGTGSVWLQVTGRAVKGPLLGTTLKCGPLLDTTWGQWKKLHPDTLVMAPDPHLKDCYEPKGIVMVRGYENFPEPYFRKTVTHRDTRLGMFESVLAVSAPAQTTCASPKQDTASADSVRVLHRAYPLKAFRGKTSVVNDVLGGTPIAVFFQAGTQTMNAVSRMVAGRTLTLEVRRNPRGRLAFYDKETGTRWNIEGKAEQGPLAGRQLRRMDSHMSQWYGWVSYFPQTTIYGQEKHAAPSRTQTISSAAPIFSSP